MNGNRTSPKVNKNVVRSSPKSGIELDGSSSLLSITLILGGGGGGGGLIVDEPGGDDDVDDTIAPAGILNSFTSVLNTIVVVVVCMFGGVTPHLTIDADHP